MVLDVPTGVQRPWLRSRPWRSFWELYVVPGIEPGSAACKACTSPLVRCPNSPLLLSARKESAKEKQLKEEEKILESVAEGRGKVLVWAGRPREHSPSAGPVGRAPQKPVLSPRVSPAALMSVKEMAKGITYDDPIKTRCGEGSQHPPLTLCHL